MILSIAGWGLHSPVLYPSKRIIMTAQLHGVGEVAIHTYMYL